eukprot:6178895-Pleurochrysis_carterae.AAC.5
MSYRTLQLHRAKCDFESACAHACVPAVRAGACFRDRTGMPGRRLTQRPKATMVTSRGPALLVTAKENHALGLQKLTSVCTARSKRSKLKGPRPCPLTHEAFLQSSLQKGSCLPLSLTHTHQAEIIHARAQDRHNLQDGERSAF